MSVGKPRRPRVSGPARWSEAFTYVLSPDYDPATFPDYARKLADGMTGPCGCVGHWRTWCAANPPDAENPFAWLWLAKNVIATRIGKPLVGHDAALAYWNAPVAR